MDIRSPEHRGAHLSLSRHYFDRVAVEFVSLDWLVDETITHFRRLLSSGPMESVTRGRRAKR